MYWYGSAFFQLNIGVTLGGLGAHADAAALLGAGLGGIPAEQGDAEWLGEYREALADAKERA